ncbi:MAG: hypothetical protein ABMA25_03770 [Ilumatobacteraceae bacterium]
MRALGVWSVAAVLMISSCSGGNDGSPSAVSTPGGSTAPSVEDTVPTDDPAADLSTYLDDEGVLSFESAKTIFAGTLAPLPDVEPAAAVVDDSETHVLTTLVSHREELTDEQWAIVEGVIGGPGVQLPDLLAADGGSVRHPFGARADAAATVIADAIDAWSTRLGRPLSGGPAMITVVEMPFIREDGTQNFANLSNAATAIRLLNDGVYDECLVRLNVDTPFNTAMFEGQVAHEIFHCFQYDLGPIDAVPMWIREGEAAYAGEIFAGGTAMSTLWWGRWIEEPTRPLTARKYDAIGLYALSNAMGTDPFGYFDDLMRTPTWATFEAAVGPRVKDFLATHYANDPAWGSEFTIVGPGAPRTQARRVPVTWAGNTASLTRSFAPDAIAAQVFGFEVPGQVLVVSSNGFGGLHFANGAVAYFRGGFLGAFCVQPGTCVCPGEGGEREGLVDASPFGFLGVGPGENPTLTSQSLEEYCASPTPTTTVAPDGPGGDGCVIGTWNVDNAVMAAVFQRTVTTATPGAPPTDFVSSEVTGTWTLQLAPDGAMTMTASNWSLTGHLLGPGGLGSDEPVPIDITITFNGTVTGRYSAADGSMTFSETNGGLSAKATGTVMGQTFDATTPQLANLPIAGNSTSTYTCGGGVLVLTPTTPNSMPMTFSAA